MENKTAHIKMWRFLEGVSSPSTEKKVKLAKAGALYASRCDVFEKTFRSLRWKKKVTQEPLLYTGEKVKRTVLPSWQN